MDASIADIKNEVERGLRLYKAFERGVEILSALEGVDQFRRDTQSKIDSLEKKGQELSSKNKDLADTMVSLMHEKDELIIRNEELEDKLKAELAAELAAEKTKINADLSSYKQKAEDARKDLASLGADLLNKKNELDDLKKQIETLKQQLKKMIGE